MSLEAAESFMAGAELGGGFLVINGLKASPRGEFMGLEDRFPGSNGCNPKKMV